MKVRKKIGELLLEEGLIDNEQLSTALAHQRNWGGRIGEIVVKLGFVSEEKLLDFLSKYFRLPKVDFTKFRVPPEAIKLISPDKARKLRAVPLGVKEEKGKRFLYVAVSDPTNLSALDEIAFLTRMPIRPVITTDTAIEAAIKYYYENSPTPPWEALKGYAPVKKEDEPEFDLAQAESSQMPSKSAEEVEKNLQQQSTSEATFKSIWDYSHEELLRGLILLLIKKGYITVSELEKELE